MAIREPSPEYMVIEIARFFPMVSRNLRRISVQSVMPAIPGVAFTSACSAGIAAASTEI